jgi:Tfp pilus assembly protein PilO
MFEIPVWAVGVGFIVLTVAVAQVVARRLIPADQLRHADRLRGRRGAKREVAEALEEVEARLGELDDMRKRLAEVEERLDFAERLLTKQREAERIVPPQN